MKNLAPQLHLNLLLIQKQLETDNSLKMGFQAVPYEQSSKVPIIIIFTVAVLTVVFSAERNPNTIFYVTSKTRQKLLFISIF